MPKSDLDNKVKHWQHNHSHQGRHSRSLLRPGKGLRVLATLAVLCISGTTQARMPAPRLYVDSEIATAGFFRLNWESDAGNFELQEASGPDFRTTSTLYRGNDLASVITGKPNGTWHYRVRSSTNTRPGPWSNAVAVTVAHHELSRALMFLALGLVVFVAIMLTVIRGKEAG